MLKKEVFNLNNSKKGWVKTAGKTVGEFCFAYACLLLVLGTVLIPGDNIFDAYKDESSQFRAKL